MFSSDKVEMQSNDRKNDDPKVNKGEAQVTPKKYDFAQTITVYVGLERVPFVIHPDIICKKSKFFKAACGKRWKEGQTRIVVLPEQDPGRFQLYLQWLFNVGVDAPVDDINEFQVLLMDMYLLGDVLDDLMFRNAMMTGLIAGVRRGAVIPGPHVFHHVWDLTPPRSPLRGFLVSWVMSSADRADLARDIESYPEELVKEIAIAGLSMTLTYSAGDFADHATMEYLTETDDK